MADTRADLFSRQLNFFIIIILESPGAVDEPLHVETGGERGPVRDGMFEVTFMDTDVAASAARAYRSTDPDHRGVR